MDNTKLQLEKFGYELKTRRESLGYSIRKLEELSGVSKTLISQLENSLRDRFPKRTTVKLLNDALKFKYNELLFLADIFFEPVYQTEAENLKWQDKLREFLATETPLDTDSVHKAISFAENILIVQKIHEEGLAEKYPELQDLL